MILIIVTVISILGIISGKLIFRKWINHLTLYCVIIGGLIFFYELKLMPYPNIIPMAWFYIISSFLAMLFGSLTVVCARNLSPRVILFSGKSNISLSIFADGGKALRNSIIFFSLIALLVAIQRWVVLVNMFGSIPAVIVNASLVYQWNHGEVEEFIPIVPAFVYVAVFLLGIYTAYRGRFSFLTFVPFIAIILKELTYFGRAELLLTLMEFFFSFFLFRHLLKDDSSRRFKFSRNNAIVATTILVVLAIATASFIRVSRGSYETFSGTSKGLNQLKESYIISPSIYLYISSDVGVFSKYLEVEGENRKFGESTFGVFYIFLSKLKIIEKPNFFPRGYYIPMWTNSGTYLRELHADFGFAGIFIGPYLIGLLMTWFWFKFYEQKSLYVFALLVYFYLIIGFSFLIIVTKYNQWYISLFFIAIYLPFLEKIANRKKNLNSKESETCIQGGHHFRIP